MSHDAIDVQALADDLIVMNDGRVRQTGSVTEVLREPVDMTVAKIVGFENVLAINVVGRDSAGVSVEHSGWRFRGVNRLPENSTATAVACIRAEDIQMRKTTTEPTQASATILEMIPEGAMLRARLKLAAGEVLQAMVPRSSAIDFRQGETISVALAPDAAVVVPNDAR